MPSSIQPTPLTLPARPADIRTDRPAPPAATRMAAMPAMVSAQIRNGTQPQSRLSALVDAPRPSSGAAALPDAILSLLPEATRTHLKALQDRQGDRPLDPERLPVGTSVSAQEKDAFSRYVQLTRRCSAGPCFVQTTPPASLRSFAEVAFWWRQDVNEQWQFCEVVQHDSGWFVPIANLRALDGVRFESLQQIKDVLTGHGFSEVGPLAACDADPQVGHPARADIEGETQQTAPRNPLHRFAHGLVRLCNGGKPG